MAFEDWPRQIDCAEVPTWQAILPRSCRCPEASRLAGAGFAPSRRARMWNTRTSIHARKESMLRRPVILSCLGTGVLDHSSGMS